MRTKKHQNLKDETALNHHFRDSIAGVRVQIAELQDVNRNALTYNVPNEILSAIFEAGLSQTLHSPVRLKNINGLFHGEREAPLFEILVSAVSRRWRSVVWCDFSTFIIRDRGRVFQSRVLYSAVWCLV
jgi:hypothetical protein